jgi:ABC-type sugar transport system permease subunit
MRPALTKALMAMPALLVYSVFILGPISLSAGISLTDWDALSPRFEFVGLTNYERAVADPAVRDSATLTIGLAFAVVFLVNAVAIPLAVLLSGGDRITRIYRTLAFYPVVLSSIVIGYAWQAMLNNRGVLNDILERLGAQPVSFLGSAQPAIASVAFVAWWSSLGLSTVLYIAALKGISAELFDAAEVDGAGRWAKFRSITFPQLAPTMTVSVTVTFVAMVGLFDTVVALTFGGPAGATKTFAFSIVEAAFTRGLFGYGSAMAQLYLIVVVFLVGALFWLLRRRERALGM